jgi:hypothetical protein
MSARLRQAEPLPLALRAQAVLELRKRQRKYLPEMEKCAGSFLYFVMRYVMIYDATAKHWIPFALWQSQQPVAEGLTLHRLVIILKARQLGMTWLVLAYALWLMLFHPAATILLFSLRDTEAMYLLGERRLKGMYARLPSWLMMRKEHEHKPTCLGCSTKYDWVQRTVTKDDGHVWILGNGSNANAFPTSAGDSYTATLAIIDEADIVPDLAALMLRVQPTIDGGGQMILLSKSNKKLPQSEFKRLYKAAKRKEIPWQHYFLPWQARPSRTQAWYDAKCMQAMATKGVLDDVWENYPATDAEALAPNSLDKRIPYKWIRAIYVEEKPIDVVMTALLALGTKSKVPLIPGLKLYVLPKKGRRYCAGADPAEGNPTSDPSSLQIVDEITGTQVAKLSGRFEVSVFAIYIESVCKFYNNAPVLVERNNHGHAVILALTQIPTGKRKIKVLKGTDGKYGWLDNKLGKVRLYDNLTETVHTEDCLIFDEDTHDQIASIEGRTLLAPEGLHDDDSDAYALAQMARQLVPHSSFQPAVAGKREGLATYKPR